ncbi:hypothetical protein N7462_009720 [Penicillium macrosclerotiorum]|uniref:uncharacterized protein n=1 Tax=Penicillium macrosclerotiorum TaxID=303699 RepID=UPI0025491BF0|nr:uncharacterized protein N7462_009720 [Penicillium macrosclerotiorum]KAJ5668650.1 hypothetical protein N7462_009720 [Penicillium macrosclerotiorum]
MSSGFDRQPEIVDDDFEDEGFENNEQLDSDEQLAADDHEAINESNIVAPGLRHAKPQRSTGYRELDEDDLPQQAK